MVVRNSLAQVLLGIGLAVGTATLVRFVYRFWSKKRQSEARKKFLFGPIEEEEIERIVTKKAIKLKLLEQARTPENNDGNTTKSATEIDVQEKDFKPSHERLVTINVIVPKEHARGFVGIQGSNIQKIQNITNTKITSQRETLDNGDRVYSILGTSADARLAELEINKYIMSQPILRTIKIDVPANAMGRIIGRNGENIRAIQDKSMARIIAEDRDDPDLPYGEPDLSTSKMRTIRIRGTDEQIEIASGFIQEAIDKEDALRRKITATTTGRTKRRVQASKFPVRSIVSEIMATNHFPLKRDGILEVFVSCVYNPNNFCIQVGSSSIDLDNLCRTMTEYYANHSNVNAINMENSNLSVGDHVAASFDDGRTYRGRILEINGPDAMVLYVDYGDKRRLPISKLYPIRTEHLKLRFQAIEATLNLDFQGDWSDEIVNEFCNLSHCADWVTMTAKVIDYLKDEENHDIIWIELFDSRDVNIGDEVLRLLGIGNGVVLPSGETNPSMIDFIVPLQSQIGLRNGVTYASIASGSGSASNNELEVPSANKEDAATNGGEV